jgi:hypothetical protein
MNKIALAFFASLALMVGSQASTITFGNVAGATTHAFTDASGGNLPNGGGFAALGTFGIGDDAISGANASGDFGAVKAGFTQFGNSLTIGFANRDGFLQGLVNGAIAGGDSFAGNSVYAVVGNGSSLDNSSDLLVFKSASTFLADPAPTDNVIVNPANGSLLLGGVGSTNVAGNDFSSYQLAGAGAGGGVDPVIPEPSSTLLGLIGLGFVALRRKR